MRFQCACHHLYSVGKHRLRKLLGLALRRECFGLSNGYSIAVVSAIQLKQTIDWLPHVGLKWTSLAAFEFCKNSRLPFRSSVDINQNVPCAGDASIFVKGTNFYPKTQSVEIKFA
jgi:hypothetical protein